MTVGDWLKLAKADAQERGLPELIPVLDGLAQATERLRAADWNDSADGPTPSTPDESDADVAQRKPA